MSISMWVLLMMWIIGDWLTFMVFQQHATVISPGNCWIPYVTTSRRDYIRRQRQMDGLHRAMSVQWSGLLREYIYVVHNKWGWHQGEIIPSFGYSRVDWYVSSVQGATNSNPKCDNVLRETTWSWNRTRAKWLASLLCQRTNIKIMYTTPWF